MFTFSLRTLMMAALTALATASGAAGAIAADAQDCRRYLPELGTTVAMPCGPSLAVTQPVRAPQAQAAESEPLLEPEAPRQPPAPAGKALSPDVLEAATRVEGGGKGKACTRLLARAQIGEVTREDIAALQKECKS